MTQQVRQSGLNHSTVEQGAGSPDAQDNGTRRRRRNAVGLGVVVGLAIGIVVPGVAYLGYVAGQSEQESDRVEALSPAEEATQSNSDAPATSTTLAEATSTSASSAEPDSGSTEESESGVADQDGVLTLPDGFTPSDPHYEARVAQAASYFVVRENRVFLYGFTQSQELLAREAALTGLITGGEDNYVVERVVDPDAPIPESLQIFVDDRVLFGYNSAEIDQESYPALGFAAGLMDIAPDARITIIARSDAQGDADYNLELSRRRGAAVAALWIQQGVDPDRIEVVARGESDAQAADEADNRSVEFVVTGVNLTLGS